MFCDYAGHEPEQFRDDLTLVADDRVLVTLNRYPFAGRPLPGQEVSARRQQRVGGRFGRD